MWWGAPFMANETPSRFSMIRNLAVLLALWEVAGRFQLVASGALPAPSAIIARFWADKSDYPPHVLATLEASFLGFLIGNTAAILAGIAFVLSPFLLRLFRGVNIAIFALPPIAISPVLVLTFSGMAPRVILAALGCYFATMTATVLGLTQADPRSLDVVRAYGGSRFDEMRLIQLRSALPSILGGFRVAAPAAVLGAILAEFGGGGRFGLGTYLLGSLGRADPPRLWGIGLTATLIAGLAYAAFAIIGNRVTGTSRAVTVPTAAPAAPVTAANPAMALILAAAAAALPLVLWWLLLTVLNVPEMIAKTPAGVFDYLFMGDGAPQARERLLAALTQTLPITLLGLAAGLAFAFTLAVLADLFPAITRSFMPVALVTQTMPLVALTPLLVLLLGRGTPLILWVTISVTFFPAFVTIAQGMAMVPRAALELPRAYGASKRQQLTLISIPASLPYLFAATRLAAPRALLGVMIAEWLATGTGLGNLLNQSRGYLDYGMIWTVAAVSVLIAVFFYQVVVIAERWTLARLGMRTTE
jgi:ABC-type nitrate/sulfonate/bicarbonate transport system permease component